MPASADAACGASIDYTVLMRRLTCLLLLLPVIAFGAGDTGESTVDGVESQLKATADRLKRLDADIAESRRLKQSLEARVSTVQGKAEERRQRIRGLNDDITRYEAQLQRLEQRLAEENALIAHRRDTLAEALRRSQRLGAGGALKVLLQHDDPALAERIGTYTEYYLRAERAAIATQIDAMHRVSSAHDEALKNRNWLNYIKKKAEGQLRDHVDRETRERRELTSVSETLASKTRTVAELRADQARLQTLLEELRAAEAIRSGYFESRRGKLALPVAGSIDARFGDVKSVGRLRWNGLFIRAAIGTAVRAIADGEVVYADWLQGFGMLVILDHGDNFMTLYGGNRDLTVRVGDWIETGQRIATVGDSGGQMHSGLYLEVRHNAKPVNPEDWVNADNGVMSAAR